MKSEIEILERLRRGVHVPPRSALVLGIGDDCAIFRPRGSREDLLFTTDMMIERIHFLASTHNPEDVGHKALARGLSDIAAMGGEPRFCLLSLAAAPWVDEKWRRGFFRGFLRLAERECVPLAGGDMAHAAETACDVVVCGAAPRGTALRRDGAKPGDAVYVSGFLGGSALGLRTQKGKAWRRHLRPEPRLRLGRFLRGRLRASAAMDISDGLSLDLHRLCRASGVMASIEAPPLFPGASLDDALHGGEDYELLFTASPAIRVPREFEGIPLTRIGTVQTGKAGRVLLDGKPLAPLGYDHFQRPAKPGA